MIKEKWRLTRVDLERMLILCASALVVVLALRQDSMTAISRESSVTTLPVTSAETPVIANAADTVSTVVYYKDGEGYLVPVTRQIDKTDGIAKATLSLMVASPANDLAAARLGLKTTVPEGTAIDLDISGKKARVDLSKEALNCQDAEQEYLMVSSVASALCGTGSFTFRKIGLNDEFGQSGKPADLLREYHLTGEQIADTILHT